MGEFNYKQFQRETEKKYKQFVNPSLSRLLKFGGFGTSETHSEGVFVFGADGEKYFDCAGGYGTFILGHRHPAIINAVRQQLDSIPLSAKVFFNRVMADLAEELAFITPGKLKYTFFCNSGAEAVESALKIARLATGKSKIIATENAFHGKTMGALSVSGRDIYKKGFAPLLPDIFHVPYNDIESINNAVDNNTAAVILEPIQGEGGIVVPSAEYLPAVKEICRKRDALFIADEVQTGMGRTGKMFAVEHWGVEPDLICLAKGLGGGVMPIGALIGTPDVWHCFDENPMIHTSTFGGGELACRAGIETINVIKEYDLIENAKLMGDYLLSGLKLIGKDFPDIIKEVRGIGLMIGVELTEEKYGGSVISEMAKRKVIGVYTLNQPKVIRFEPPMIINSQHADLCCRVFKESTMKTRERFII